MPRRTQTKRHRSTAETVRSRIGRGGARLWKYSDFDDLPATAVAKALSRLAQEGALRRVAKGVYYHPEQTSFGPSMASSMAVAAAGRPEDKNLLSLGAMAFDSALACALIEHDQVGS